MSKEAAEVKWGSKIAPGWEHLLLPRRQVDVRRGAERGWRLLIVLLVLYTLALGPTIFAFRKTAGLDMHEPLGWLLLWEVAMLGLLVVTTGLRLVFREFFRGFHLTVLSLAGFLTLAVSLVLTVVIACGLACVAVLGK